jgi:hypothetical protein
MYNCRGVVSEEKKRVLKFILAALPTFLRG